MTAALRTQLLWCTTGIDFNLLEYVNMFRPFVHAYNTYRMNRYLVRELDERYRSIKGGRELKSKNKSVVDLALRAYLAENPTATGIDKNFQDFAMAQIKLFIFAGHDTTSAGAVFTYHLLFQHPTILDKVRAEHSRVLGPDPLQAESLIFSNPHLLNQLPYTLAAIKESLRMYPTVAALRDGQPDFFLVGDNGLRFPTDQTIVWGDHYGVHHNPAHWPRPREFLPERWLVPENHELYPPKNAWRPFERGPRNCIGQDVAMTEIKLMLALTVREFDIRDAYEEYDSMKKNPKGWNVNGQRAYMMRRGGGHPADFYPCRISRVNGGTKEEY
jgi:cytochrome P450